MCVIYLWPPSFASAAAALLTDSRGFRRATALMAREIAQCSIGLATYRTRCTLLVRACSDFVFRLLLGSRSISFQCSIRLGSGFLLRLGRKITF